MPYIEKSYSTIKVAYTELLTHLEDKGDLISRDENPNQFNSKVVYSYKASAVILHLKCREVYLSVEKKTEKGANKVFNELEKILLTGKI